jgi:hypothetical protein
VNTTMNGEAMGELRLRVGQVVRRAARDVFKASIVETPVEGYQILTRSTLDDPRAGIRAASAVRGIADSLVDEYTRAARAAGRSWDEIAEVLGVEDDRESWCGRGELVYRLLVEDEPLPGAVRSPFGRSSTHWRCGSCGGLVTDRGPFEAHPTDNESGHAESCTRHAGEIAAYERDRGW